MSRLDDDGLRILLTVSGALISKTDYHRAPQSDFVDDRFAKMIASQLVVYHAFHHETANKKWWEYLFKTACEARGWRTELNPGHSRGPHDAIVKDTKVSLKTETTRGDPKSMGLYIQKLMEARWIRDLPPPPKLGIEAAQKILAHLDRYDRILVFRGRKFDQSTAQYALIEVPKTIFSSLRTEACRGFPEKNLAGSSGIDLLVNNQPAARILLDGSVEKVRLFNVRSGHFVLHAAWTIPITAPSILVDEEVDSDT